MLSGTGFKPVKTRHTVQDQVYDQLREALVKGAFEAGQPMTIAALSETFKTSHMPVREALRRLAAENALRISSTGTAMVPEIDPEELRQICQARLVLEPATVAIAFDNLDAAAIAELRGIHAAHRNAGDAGDVVAMLAANRDFHFRLYEASQNAVLVSQIENLWLRSGPYVRYLSDKLGDLLRTTYKSSYARYHETMIEALVAGDRESFTAAMRADIAATHELLFDFLRKDG